MKTVLERLYPNKRDRTFFIVASLAIAVALFVFFVYYDGYHVILNWAEKASSQK